MRRGVGEANRGRRRAWGRGSGMACDAMWHAAVGGGEGVEERGGDHADAAVCGGGSPRRAAMSFL